MDYKFTTYTTYYRRKSLLRERQQDRLADSLVDALAASARAGQLPRYARLLRLIGIGFIRSGTLRFRFGRLFKGVPPSKSPRSADHASTASLQHKSTP